MTVLILLAVGVLIGNVFDLFRSLRRACGRHPRWAVHGEDILCLLVSCALLIMALYLTDLGRVRGYMFFLAAGGVCLYFLGVSPWLGRILTGVFEIPRRIARFFSKRILKKRKKQYIMSQQ